jgi:hypothetical protein
MALARLASGARPDIAVELTTARLALRLNRANLHAKTAEARDLRSSAFALNAQARVVRARSLSLAARRARQDSNL